MTGNAWRHWSRVHVRCRHREWWSPCRDWRACAWWWPLRSSWGHRTHGRRSQEGCSLISFRVVCTLFPVEGHIVGLVVYYGITNTIVLEIPYFTTKSGAYNWMQSRDGLQNETICAQFCFTFATTYPSDILRKTTEWGCFFSLRGFRMVRPLLILFGANRVLRDFNLLLNSELLGFTASDLRCPSVAPFTNV